MPIFSFKEKIHWMPKLVQALEQSWSKILSDERNFISTTWSLIGFCNTSSHEMSGNILR